MKIVMKLGGSVITKKEVNNFPKSVDEIKKCADNFIHIDNLKRIGSEIFEAMHKTINKHMQLILINGAGPFGHYLVAKRQPLEIVHSSVEILNERVIANLNNNLQIESVAPNETCFWKNGKFVIDELWKRGQKIIASNKIFSTYGDILKSYKVISGDDLAVLLAKMWHADKIISVIDKDGVFNKNPELYTDAKLIKTVRSLKDIKFETITTDVTGGLEAKIKKFLSVNIKSQIINGLVAGNVKSALLGNEEIGTMVVS